MSTKKKSSITVMSAMLSASTILSPIAVQAQENPPNDDFIAKEQSELYKEQAPMLVLPEGLMGEVGQSLQSVRLPEGWSWVHSQEIITRDNQVFPARYAVDDIAYDYSKVEGYYAEGHYVECKLTIQVKEQGTDMGVLLAKENFATEIASQKQVSPIENAVLINEENFPDSVFRAYVSENFDTSNPKDGVLSTDEILKIKSINVNFKKEITSLKGIEHFSELEKLYCLDLWRLTSLDVRANKKLVELNCEGAMGIQELDVSNNKELISLNCGYTSLTSIDVTNNKKLENLLLNRTKIASVNVSKNQALKFLNCIKMEKLTELNLSNNPLLDYLEIGETNIRGLDISKNTALTKLYYDKTPLLWIHAGSNMQNQIVLPSTSISTNSLEDTFVLTDIVKDIDLKRVRISNHNGQLNQTTGIISNYDKNLPIQYAYDCGTDANGKTIELTVNILVAVDIDEKNFPDQVFREYVKEFDRDKDHRLSATELANVKTLYADKSNGKGSIHSLQGIEFFTALQRLECSDTQIKNLDVSKNIELQMLTCQGTALTDLDVRNNTKLTKLGIAITQIDTLDISRNTKLIELGIGGTKITELDVTQNTALEKLYLRNTRIKELDVTSNQELIHLDVGQTDITELDLVNNTKLLQLYCDEMQIKELDITSNSQLTHVWCNDTQLTSLDVSKNPALEVLACYKTKLEGLDLRNNKELIELSCSQTPIKELDVSMLPKLKYLYTWATNIRHLDLSHNPNLVLLDTPRTNLGYLSFNSTSLQELYMDTSTSTVYTVKEKTFDITEAFKGIDLNKISNFENAEIDSQGIVSSYTMDTPITYTYECGMFNGEKKFLQVTLQLAKSNSSIEIIDALDAVYSGNAISEPNFKKTGSKGAVSFQYEEKKGDTWEAYSGTPIHAGVYRVTAHVNEDDFYEGATSEARVFTISQAVNDWVAPLEIKDWIYGEKEMQPTAAAIFGEVSYSYSAAKDGIYADVIPTEAGTWYVKASVPGTQNYTGIEAVQSFTISSRDVLTDSNIQIPEINKEEDVNTLVIKDGDTVLVEGIDYTIEKKQDGNKVIVTITFTGNYRGTFTRSYTIVKDSPKEESKDNSMDTQKEESKVNDNGIVNTGFGSQSGWFTIISLLPAGCMALLSKKRCRK